MRDMIIPFGKYKGLHVEEVVKSDTAYLYWLVDQDFTAEKFPIIYNHLLTVLGIRIESIEMSGSIKAIIARVKEALMTRGFSESESVQMINRLMIHKR